MRCWAVVPAWNERETIAEVVRGAPWELLEGMVVVDGGSSDGTGEAARAAGAELIVERRRGYGRAMMRGIEEARRRGAQAYVLYDGNGTAAPTDVRRVLAPVAAGRCDVAIGSRPLARLRAAQRAGNRLAIWAIARAHRVRLGDVGAIRAVSDAALRRLDLNETTYGWPLQLLVRAARHALRIEDVPVGLAPRGGRSKISGTFTGTAGATLCFLRVLVRECGP